MVSSHPQVHLAIHPSPHVHCSPQKVPPPHFPTPWIAHISPPLLPHSGSPFGPAATSLGLHVWWVELPEEVPEATLGIFFLGDTYLVLLHNGTEEQAHLHL